jgi:ankyrin repeat protein
MKKTIIIVLVIFLLFVIPVLAGEIHDAATKGDLTKVKALLKKDARLLNAGDDNKKQPIHWASQHGHLEIVKFLLGRGAAVNCKNVIDETPLHYASALNHKEIAKLLLAKGAAVNAKTTNGDTPLNYALNRNNNEIIGILVDNGADVMWKRGNGWTTLHDAAWRGSGKVIEFLIEKGIPVDAKAGPGRTPLHCASMGGNLEGIQTLIKKGANVNSKADNNWTPLFLAMGRGHAAGVTLLLKLGAKVEDNYLHTAAIKGLSKIAYLLLENGANPNAKDKKGKTPLDYACRYSHKKVAKILLGKGANKEDLKKSFGPSPLLKKQLKEGDAIVWHTGHSGWAIKTKNHLLVFDYFKIGPMPDTPFLANGTINTGEIKDLNVAVFSSHAHGDHYMPAIFDWKKDVPNITYIMGFKAQDKKDGYTYLSPRQKKEIKGMKVITIESNDSGVAFFVKVDGVNIFHSGDHANRKRDFSGPFKKEIDFLAAKGLKPDIFFAPVSGCGFGDLEAVKKGVYYTIKKLSPRAVFPMHAGGGEYQYADFAKAAKKAGIDVPMYCAENSGDLFYIGPAAGDKKVNR